MSVMSGRGGGTSAMKAWRRGKDRALGVLENAITGCGSKGDGDRMDAHKISTLVRKGQYEEALQFLPVLFLQTPGLCIDEGTKLSLLLMRKAEALRQQGQTDMANELNARRAEVEHAVVALLNTLNGEQLQRLFHTINGERALRHIVTRKCKLIATNLRIVEMLHDVWRGEIVTSLADSPLALAFALLWLIPLNLFLMPAVALYPPLQVGCRQRSAFGTLRNGSSVVTACME